MDMSNMALRCFAIAMPAYLVNTVLMNFYQCTKRVGISSMICILQLLIYPLVFAFILIRPLGATGVWMAFLLGELLTLITIVFVINWKNKKLVSSLDDIMMLDEDLEERCLVIWRIMFPEEHQNKGYGTEAIKKIVELARECGKYDFMILDYVPENKIAEHLYTKIGFKPTGEESNGEIVLRMDL